MSFTGKTLNAALHSIDKKVKAGIMDGNINEVMGDIKPEIVS